MSVEAITFGCRLNALESETMRDLAERAGHHRAVVVNTCAVTAEAEKQARKAIRAAHRRNPAAPILVTGCAARIDPARWAALPGVARIIPNTEKLRPESWAFPSPALEADAATSIAADSNNRRHTHPSGTSQYDGRSASAQGAADGDNRGGITAGAMQNGVLGGFGIGADGSAVAEAETAAEAKTPSHRNADDPGTVLAASREDADARSDPRPSRTRAFLQIQGGCDHACTFCVIPQGRGPSFSVPTDTLAERLRRLVEQGHKEAVLTGVDIASHGADLPGRPSLGATLRRLLAAVPELPRLRLSSLDPAALDDDLWRLLAEEPRLMPHLHLSLQHGADLILKRMKRRHSRADALRAARRARAARPDLALGADLIAGFPTETETHLRDTLALVDEMGLSFLHVFPYSERPNTPAARMPPVPVPLRRERAARLRDAGAAAAARFHAGRVGQVETVLFEAGNRGHTEHFAPLRLPDGVGPVPRGTLRRVRAIAVDAEGLVGSTEGTA